MFICCHAKWQYKFWIKFFLPQEQNAEGPVSLQLSIGVEAEISET